MPSVELSRDEFEKRYRSRFADPAFEPLSRELDAITAAAWDAYSNSRKAPLTRKAGPGFADPDYDFSVDGFAAREAILAAQRRHDDAGETPRILLINGSSRSDQTSRNAARAFGNAVNLSRAGKYQRPDQNIEDPNPN
jgi:hypothetical protein